MHHAALMLENNSYVRCLLIDFSKAYDIVKHAVILSELSALDLPSSVLNWIIAFLTDRTQVCKTTDGRFSAMHPITRRWFKRINLNCCPCYDNSTYVSHLYFVHLSI